MYQFDFSENQMKKTNRYMLFVMLPMTMFFAAAFGLFVSDFKVGEALMVSGFAFLMGVIIFAIEIPLLNRSFRKMKVLVYEDRIVRQCSKKNQDILWGDIIKIKLTQNPKGDLEHIRLYQKDKRAVWLGGFNEMETMADLIKQKISEDVLVQTKRNRLDARNPIIIFLIVIGVLAAMCAISSMGSKVVDIFSIFASLGIGSWLLIYRPLARFDINIKWFELIGGGLLIILGIYALIEFLLTGKIF